MGPDSRQAAVQKLINELKIFGPKKGLFLGLFLYIIAEPFAQITTKATSMCRMIAFLITLPKAFNSTERRFGW